MSHSRWTVCSPSSCIFLDDLSPEGFTAWRRERERERERERDQVASCCCCWGDLLKKLNAPSFQTTSGRNFAGLFSKECASNYRVQFRIWRHNFKMAVISRKASSPPRVISLARSNGSMRYSTWSIVHSDMLVELTGSFAYFGIKLTLTRILILADKLYFI